MDLLRENHFYNAVNPNYVRDLLICPTVPFIVRQHAFYTRGDPVSPLRGDPVSPQLRSGPSDPTTLKRKTIG